MYPVVLTGRRLVLREVRPDDLEPAFDFASDPLVTRWLPFEPVESRIREKEILTSMIEQAHEQPRVQYDLSAELIATGEMIGECRIGVTPRQYQAADIGYGFRRAFWGQGFATEAAALLVDFGFRALKMHRVWATHHPDNRASARILKKIGMTEEGRIRDHLFVHGAWRDSICWSVLEHEWKAPQARTMTPP